MEYQKVESSVQIIYFEFEPETEVLYIYTENLLYLFAILAFFIGKCRFFSIRAVVERKEKFL